MIPRDLSDRRLDLIEKRDFSKKSEISSRTFRVLFNGQQNDLHVFKLDIDYPFYRIDNGRTRRGQINYLKRNPSQQDLFKKDTTSVAAQSAQHEILLDMVAEADLLQLLKDYGQENPIILTSTGFALNGNRRLAAMRKLHEDPKEQQVFSSVDVVLLPDLEDKELRMIELRLQMAQEGKASYHWLDELLTIRDDLKSGMTHKEIATAMNKKPKTIKILLTQLTLIDRYLHLMQKDEEYDVIDPQKQAFKDIAEQYIKLEKSPKLQNEYLAIAFNLVAFPEGAGRSVHDNLVSLEKNLHSSIVEFGKAVSSNKKLETEIKQGETAISRALASASEDFRKIEIGQALALEAHKAVSVATQTSAIEDKANGPFNAVSEANRLLSQIKITGETTMKSQVHGQLKAIIKKAGDLLRELGD